MIGDEHAVDPLDRGLDVGAVRPGCGHGAQVSASFRIRPRPGLDHEAPTRLGDGVKLARVKDARGVQCGKLAIGMARRHVGGEPHVPQDRPKPGFDRAKGGLGVRRHREFGSDGLYIVGLVSARGQDQPAERAAKRRVGIGERARHGREIGRHIGEHLGILAALAREDERQLAALGQERLGGKGRAGGQGRGRVLNVRKKRFQAVRNVLV